jgi:hypothetical protein
LSKTSFGEALLLASPEGPMPTPRKPEPLEFASVERRRVVAAFDVGTASSDAGALLLGKADRADRPAGGLLCR